ncbi:MAG: NnrS family protein [Methyloversatilis sp.]|nr:NnrS family protein [Methyloversatilis sp.]
MATLLSIQEAEQPLPHAPSWSSFLELGFRPVYLAGALWALIAVGLWIFAPHWLNGPLAGVAWHAHEMLWGFVATIAVGFLMTAGAAWTGINPVQGRALAILCALWLVARLGFLAGDGTPFLIATLAELLFFALAAAALLRAVVVSRNARNYGVPLLLLALGVSDALFLLAAHDGDPALLMRPFNAGLLIMTLIALLVARRVIPFFAMRAVPGLQIPMQLRSGHLQLGASGIAVVCLLADLPIVQALALAVAGALSLQHWLSWKPQAVLRKPLLWILYLGYLSLGVGLLLAAASVAGFGARPALHIHVIAMGGFSLLIIGMITRTALGHLGRPLETDRSMVASYGLVIAATVLRLLALQPSAAALHLLHVAALLWVAAFALYLWRFVPMMIRPRADRPAPAAAPLAAPVTIVRPGR